MLYEELYKLCPGCTYEQFENIERIYNTCPNMSKEGAAEIWRLSYGKEIEQEKHAAENLISQLFSGTAPEEVVRYFAREIQAARKENIFCDTIKSKGIQLRGVLVGNINHGSIMRYELQVFHDGSWARTAYQYNTPDLYIWTI